jgi:HAD superfamily hydrolase (TIGR01509 family)
VLVDSESISAKVFREMILELGFNIDFKLILKQITGTSMKENLDFFAEQTGAELPVNFESEFRKRSFETFKTELKPIDGVAEILKSVNTPMGVASSGPLHKIELSLSTTGLINNFGHNIFSCYEIGKWKPEPDIYLHAAKKMGFEPHECAVVEDSEPGIKAALSGGFNVFAFTNRKNKAPFEKLGATVFYEMKELFHLLDIDK